MPSTKKDMINLKGKDLSAMGTYRGQGTRG